VFLGQDVRDNGLFQELGLAIDRSPASAVAAVTRCGVAEIAAEVLALRDVEAVQRDEAFSEILGAQELSDLQLEALIFFAETLVDERLAS
jgi:hypothetical protein